MLCILRLSPGQAKWLKAKTTRTVPRREQLCVGGWGAAAESGGRFGVWYAIAYHLVGRQSGIREWLTQTTTQTSPRRAEVSEE